MIQGLHVEVHSSEEAALAARELRQAQGSIHFMDYCEEGVFCNEPDSSPPNGWVRDSSCWVLVWSRPQV